MAPAKHAALALIAIVLSFAPARVYGKRSPANFDVSTLDTTWNNGMQLPGEGDGQPNNDWSEPVASNNTFVRDGVEYVYPTDEAGNRLEGPPAPRYLTLPGTTMERVPESMIGQFPNTLVPGTDKTWQQAARDGTVAVRMGPNGQIHAIEGDRSAPSSFALPDGVTYDDLNAAFSNQSGSGKQTAAKEMKELDRDNSANNVRATAINGDGKGGVGSCPTDGGGYCAPPAKTPPPKKNVVKQYVDRSREKRKVPPTGGTPVAMRSGPGGPGAEIQGREVVPGSDAKARKLYGKIYDQAVAMRNQPPSGFRTGKGPYLNVAATAKRVGPALNASGGPDRSNATKSIRRLFGWLDSFKSALGEHGDARFLVGDGALANPQGKIDGARTGQPVIPVTDTCAGSLQIKVIKPNCRPRQVAETAGGPTPT